MASKRRVRHLWTARIGELLITVKTSWCLWSYCNEAGVASLQIGPVVFEL